MIGLTLVNPKLRRPLAHSGRGATLADLNYQRLQFLWSNIKLYIGPEAAAQMVYMVADLPCLSMTDFLLALYRMEEYAIPIVVVLGIALVGVIYKVVTDEMAAQARYEKTMRWYYNELQTVREEVCIVDPPARYEFKRCETTIRRLTIYRDIVGQLPTTTEILLDDARTITVPAIKLMHKMRPIHPSIGYAPYLIF